MIDPSIITRGAEMAQLQQRQNMDALADLGGSLGQLVLGRRINQMRQLKTPEEQQAFANNSIFSPMLNTQLTADRSAAAKAANDQLKFNADLGKTYGEIGKIGAETGEIDAKTGKITTETGITRQNNTGSIWSAFLTGGPVAAKAQLENMKNNGVISPESYQAELNALTNMPTNAAEAQQYALGRFKGLQDPKYSLTTADNVLDNQTSVDNNVRSTSVQKYGIDKTAETADENRAVQMQRLEFDQQQAEIKNGQGEIKEANGKLWIVYKDGTARPAVDANGTQLAASKANNPQAQAQNEEAMRIQRVDTILPEVEKLLPKATGSYAGAAVDFLGKGIGVSTEGAKATAQLKTLAGQLVALMPKMSGPQSDKDVQMYREMAGELADDTKPIATRLAALQSIKQLNDKYREINNRSGQLQQGQVPSSGAGGRPPLSSFFQ
jgi:hypothetical protein